jgi:leucyl aminopeptidase
MDFTVVANLESRKHADLLVLPFWQVKGSVKGVSVYGKLESYTKTPLETSDFKGKEGEVLYLYTDEKQEKRIAMLGLGDSAKLNVERLRRSFSNLTKSCHSKKIKNINVVTPLVPSLSEEDVVRAVSEGLLLSNYTFNRYRGHSKQEHTPSLLEKVTLIAAGKHGLSIADKYKLIVEGVYLARDLVNGNADDITPTYLAEVATGFAKEFKSIKTTILNKKRLEKEKMGLLLAVNRGSRDEPVLIIMEYVGNPKSKEKTIVVGKGVTYDTGGLNLKPTGSMETMKCDMGGAATAFGTIYSAAKLKLKTNLTVVVPSTENSISAESYKPGDVYTSYNGKTVEIGNTDAEGRLILADALSYAVKNLHPTQIIDFATLTGAMEIALGNETTGLMSNNDALADSLIRAGSDTFERAWRLPLFEEYKDQLKSDIADIRNIGGRAAGSITAALFLQEFVENTPWAHFDIAGTAFLNDAKRYHPKYGTGIGVRLMIDFLQNLG